MLGFALIVAQRFLHRHYQMIASHKKTITNLMLFSFLFFFFAFHICESLFSYHKAAFTVFLLCLFVAPSFVFFYSFTMRKKRNVQKNTNNNVDWIIGNHAIGTIRKFPTLPLNANGVWIDPAGGVWRQAAAVTKDGIADYAQVSSTAPTLPLPDYER